MWEYKLLPKSLQTVMRQELMVQIRLLNKLCELILLLATKLMST